MLMLHLIVLLSLKRIVYIAVDCIRCFIFFCLTFETDAPDTMLPRTHYANLWTLLLLCDTATLVTKVAGTLLK